MVGGRARERAAALHAVAACAHAACAHAARCSSLPATRLLASPITWRHHPRPHAPLRASPPRLSMCISLMRVQHPRPPCSSPTSPFPRAFPGQPPVLPPRSHAGRQRRDRRCAPPRRRTHARRPCSRQAAEQPTAHTDTAGLPAALPRAFLLPRPPNCTPGPCLRHPPPTAQASPSAATPPPTHHTLRRKAPPRGRAASRCMRQGASRRARSCGSWSCRRCSTLRRVRI